MAFQYTGYQTMIYFKYLDLLTGHTLVANPGGEYEMQATESGPIPPGDGRWTSAPPPPPAPLKPPLPPLQKETKAASSDVKAGE